MRGVGKQRELSHAPLCHRHEPRNGARVARFPLREHHLSPDRSPTVAHHARTSTTDRRTMPVVISPSSWGVRQALFLTIRPLHSYYQKMKKSRQRRGLKHKSGITHLFPIRHDDIEIARIGVKITQADDMLTGCCGVYRNGGIFEILRSKTIPHPPRPSVYRSAT